MGNKRQQHPIKLRLRQLHIISFTPYWTFITYHTVDFVTRQFLSSRHLSLVCFFLCAHLYHSICLKFRNTKTKTRYQKFTLHRSRSAYYIIITSFVPSFSTVLLLSSLLLLSAIYMPYVLLLFVIYLGIKSNHFAVFSPSFLLSHL